MSYHRRRERQGRSASAVASVFLWLLLADAVQCQGQEGYFNGSSYVLLDSVLSPRGRTSLGFRTCSHGELLYQEGSSGDTLQLVLLSTGSLQLRWLVQGTEDSVQVGQNLIDNVWHDIDLMYYLGTVTLQVGTDSILVANGTVRTRFLDVDLNSSRPVLFVGRNFTGCLLQGAGVVLNVPSALSVGVSWDGCPLPDRSNCDGYQVDHCFSQPCHKFSRCISQPDGYECLCTTRYTGINCHIDLGPLCDKPENQCLNDGMCQEDKTGNQTACACAPKYTGRYCETRVNNSFCDMHPCRNGGTCNVNEFSDGYICTCPQGFAGADCELNIDECQSSPCHNGGTCTDEVNGYNCDCTGTGYTGPNCETNINECIDSNPCAHGSTCFDRYGDYLCLCPPGFHGKNCTLNIDECQSSPCRNGATCRDRVDSYDCLCLPGFQGKNCEINIDDCQGIVCPENSRCVDDIGNYTCACNPGYSGTPPYCYEIDECLSNPCYHGATCMDHINGYFCRCLLGFEGQQCETNIDDCSSAPCVNGGSCVDGINSYRCDCTPGFSGVNCEFDVNECDTNPCKNGARCTDLINDYLCDCLPGWEGKNCTQNIDECQSQPCQHGTCVDIFNNYTCICQPGFSGRNCEANTDDCVPNPCRNGGTCRDLVNDFHCNCTANFMGKTCTQMYDACHANPCYNGGTCSTAPPSHDYNCICPAGFVGEQCEVNVDDCVGVTCPAGQVCFDQIDSYVCQCPEGFSGQDCSININECNSDPCINGTCLDGIANFTCVCPPGLTGKLCELDVDECADNPCRYGICQNMHGSFRCYCTPGYTGRLCHIDINECNSSPCQNLGSCLNLVSDYRCMCVPGFTGRNCETNIDECASQPCINGGACIDQINEYRCACLPGFSGVNCEVNIDECESQPCQNGGTCIDLINGYQCNCTDTGFQGANCESNIDDCAASPCQHGSSCEDLIKDYRCHCYRGFEGKHCEVDIPECASFPCANGGTCLELSNRTLYEENYHGLFSMPFSYETAGGYKCECPLGFAGTDCEVNIDDCVNHTCINGTCIDGINSYLCQCFPGFEGVFCANEIDECERYAPCENGATCSDRIADYQCYCAPMFGGKNCSVQLIGCNDHACQNDAMCEPYLDDNQMHRYRCHCPVGFQGTLCNMTTAASFDGYGYWELLPKTLSTNSLDISLHFRTTLSGGILSAGIHPSSNFSYVLYLLDGGIHFNMSNRDGSVSLVAGTQLNDSEWKDVAIQVSALQITLRVAGVNTTRYPIRPILNLGFPNLNITVGGSHFRDQANYFVGCIREIRVNSDLQIPYAEDLPPSVRPGCNRRDQCKPSPCEGNGRCEDLWLKALCHCHRPYFGERCQYEFQAATFGHEHNISWADVTIPQERRASLRDSLEISMFVRTRKDGGLIFYLGSMFPGDTTGRYLPTTPSNYASFLALSLESGNLHAMVKTGGGGGDMVSVYGRDRLDNGNYHFVEVFQNNWELKLTVNGTAVDQTVLGGGQLNAEVLYLGWLPHLAGRDRNRYRRQITNSGFSGDLYVFENISNFKGIIQDMRVGDSRVDLFPASFPVQPRTVVPALLGTPNIHHVLMGVVSDHACISNPCQHGGSCNTTWNDFSCSCTADYRGKMCQELRPCAVNTCPEDSRCNDLEQGYECISTSAFDGKSTWIQYMADIQNTTLNTIVFQYRSKQPGTVLYIQSNVTRSHFVHVEVNDTFVLLQWNLGPDEIIKTAGCEHNSTQGDWRRVVIQFEKRVKVVCDSETPGSIGVAEDPSATNLNGLMGDGSLVLLGRSVEDRYFNDRYFKGCLHEVRIGNILLPFFTPDQLPNDTSPSQFRVVDQSNLHHGCILCWEESCSNGGYCQNEVESYDCFCRPGFRDMYCSTDIDECEDADICENGGICRNTVGSFECHCSYGFKGQRCNEKIDFCALGVCQHGGTCSPLLPAGYNCTCTAEYTGLNCTIYDPCGRRPCQNNGICEPRGTEFRCRCPVGYNGTTCEDVENPCRHRPCGDFGCQRNISGYVCNCGDGIQSRNCYAYMCAERNPCEHGGNCTSYYRNYTCECPEGYTGQNCTECDFSITCQKKILDDSSNDVLWVILLTVGCCLLVGVLIGVVMFVRVAKKKRATRGTYSPSRQEMYGSRVEMNHVMKPPPEERLI